MMKHSVLLAGLACLSMAATPASADMADHPATEKLRVAAEVGFAPFNFRQADGSISGFSYDVSQEIAKRLGRPGYDVVDIAIHSSAVRSARRGIRSPAFTCQGEDHRHMPTVRQTGAGSLNKARRPLPGPVSPGGS